MAWFDFLSYFAMTSKINSLGPKNLTLFYDSALLQIQSPFGFFGYLFDLPEQNIIVFESVTEQTLLGRR